MPDALFADPRLAAIYDLVDGDRGDLDVYASLADDVGATAVLDIGCGTGTFACLLASRGKEVVAIDPAAASLEVARRKAHAGRVRWLEGDATGLPPLAVDLVTMTGNVAQVFLGDAEWSATLAAARAALRPGGSLIFETRDPARRAWERWTPEATRRRVDTPAGAVDTWLEVTGIELPYVSFRHTFVFDGGGTERRSHSTLRFRERDEVIESLVAAGLQPREVRDAPDRPGLEIVVIAQRPTWASTDVAPA